MLSNDPEKLVSHSVKENYCEVMKRPGMYIGQMRLDYLRVFMQGHVGAIADMDNTWFENDNWEFFRDMQQWLFMYESVSMQASSLNSWSVFFRYFGKDQLAMSRFSAFLRADVPKVNFIYENQLFHDNTINGEIYGVLEHDDKESVTIKQMKAFILQTVMEMAGEIDVEYDEVRIYVRKDKFYLQLRFVVHTQNGWFDDTAIIRNLDNYERILKMHAYLHKLESADIHEIRCYEKKVYTYLDDTELFDKTPMNLGSDITDDTTFYHDYLQWKNFSTISF